MQRHLAALAERPLVVAVSVATKVMRASGSAMNRLATVRACVEPDLLEHLARVGEDRLARAADAIRGPVHDRDAA